MEKDTNNSFAMEVFGTGKAEHKNVVRHLDSDHGSPDRHKCLLDTYF